MKKLGMILVLCLMATFAYGQTVVFEDDFEDYAVGSFPSGYYAHWGQWAVYEEGGNKYFRNTRSTCSGYVCTLTPTPAWSGEAYWIVEFRLRDVPYCPSHNPVDIGVMFIDGNWGAEVIQQAGIYITDDGKVNAYENWGGTIGHKREVISTHSLTLQSGEWYDVKMIVSGRTSQLFINDNFIAEHTFNEDFYTGWFNGPLGLVWNTYGYISVDDIVVSSYSPSFEATLDIAPNTIKKKSKGKWITAFIELPEDYNVLNVLVDTILLNGTVEARQVPVTVGDHDEDGIADLMVKFSREEVIGILEAGENIKIAIAGEMEDGTVFSASDMVKVLN